ncbi:MAG: precorrin-6A reductase [Firmicutes bacterium]|nr:precorrin-6A reductase [Bacillota bacterium]
MILLLGGTRESVEAAERLRLMGIPHLVTVATDEGREALGGSDQAVRSGSLDCEGLKALIKEKAVELVLDCTHPFAVEASSNAIRACADLRVRYLRLEREGLKRQDYPGLVRAEGFREAAAIAAESEGPVMLTIGVRHLGEFVPGKPGGPRTIARVLPTPASIQRCRELGFASRDIIAAQGPFSAGLNQAIFEEYQIRMVVTKDSGETGGVEAKLEAVMRMGIKLVLINRPKILYPEIVFTVDDLINEVVK